VHERVSTKSFVVLIIGNSESNHLGAQGTFNPYPQVNPGLTRPQTKEHHPLVVSGSDLPLMGVTDPHNGKVAPLRGRSLSLITRATNVAPHAQFVCEGVCRVYAALGRDLQQKEQQT